MPEDIIKLVVSLILLAVALVMLFIISPKLIQVAAVLVEKLVKEVPHKIFCMLTPFC
jgi:uncharacterized membrane protein YkgB